MKFSLFSEGPIYRFYVWTGLAKKPLLFYRRRILIICLFAWLPLFIFSALSSTIKLHLFINDIDVHVRLLISLALLLYAEVVANERLQIVVNQFLRCHIIIETDQPKYANIVASANKWSRSSLAEIIIFIFVITVGRLVSNQVVPFDISLWYANQINNTVTLTLPGYWYAYVSLPLFQFFLLRWYYRIFIWYRFLWQVSKLKLQLNSLHPDKSGGLGFLVNSIYGLEPFLMAHSFLLAGIILNAILNTQASLWNFESEIISWLFIILLIPLIPMLFFITKLTRVKRNGTNEYDIVANHYVSEFRQKWILAEPSSHEKLLGSPDIQSLADLTNSFMVSAQMRIIPLSKNTIFFILFFSALPFLPLLLTVIPLDKIINQVMGILF